MRVAKGSVALRNREQRGPNGKGGPTLRGA